MRVSCVLPGGVRTNIHRNARFFKTANPRLCREDSIECLEKMASLSPRRSPNQRQGNQEEQDPDFGGKGRVSYRFDEATHAGVDHQAGSTLHEKSAPIQRMVSMNSRRCPTPRALELELKLGSITEVELNSITDHFGDRCEILVHEPVNGFEHRHSLHIGLPVTRYSAQPSCPFAYTPATN